MDKLFALLAKGQFDFAEDEGDEDIALNFTIDPPDGGVDRFSIIVDVNNLKDYALKHSDGRPVDFSEIYDEYELDEYGEPKDDDDEEDEEDDEEDK